MNDCCKISMGRWFDLLGNTYWKCYTCGSIMYGLNLEEYRCRVEESLQMDYSEIPWTTYIKLMKGEIKC